MAVDLGPGFSVVARTEAMKKCTDEQLKAMGPIYSADMHLTVFGPYYSTDIPFEILRASGLEYFDDYFEMAHDGGTVPPWCKILLEADSDK